MPTATEHGTKAEHNLAFLDRIVLDDFSDWMAIAAFYTAVHLVEQLRALVGEHRDGHTDRNRTVRQNYPEIHRHYRELFNCSILARYGRAQDFWLTAADVRELLVANHLNPIRQFVAQRLAAEAP
jgi:hypothetical protein